MKCLEDLKNKVEEGIVANLAVIKEVLNLMKCMFELEHHICSTEANPQGLILDLQRLLTILDCTYPHSKALSDLVCQNTNPNYDPPALEDLDCLTCKNECGPDIVITQVPAPVSCEVSTLNPQLCIECGNSYIGELENKWHHAKELVCYLKCVWDHFKRLEQQAKSNYDSTKAALDAATKAKDKCKK